MKKFLKSFVVFLALMLASVRLVNAATPTPSPTPGPVSSFEMFWPVVAGKVSGESMYNLKLLKEKVREVFIFSDYKKADYNIILSVKRVVEAEKLYLTDKKYDEAQKTLKMAQEKRLRTLELIKKASEKGDNVADLRNAFKSSLEKQVSLEKYIQLQIPDSEKEKLSEDIKSAEKIASELQ